MIDDKGWQIVLVHMGATEETLPGIEGSKLEGAIQLSDPDCELYRSFGLGKGSVWQLAGPTVWLRGFQALLSGNRVGQLAGDGLQMPGMFLVSDSEVIGSHIAKHAADHGSVPDLCKA